MAFKAGSRTARRADAAQAAIKIYPECLNQSLPVIFTDGEPQTGSDKTASRPITK